MDVFAGVDTVAITLSRPDIVRDLQRLARFAMTGAGKQFIGRPGGDSFQLRLGKRGAVVASVGSITVGTYLRSTDALFIEGRLASMLLGDTAAPRALAQWSELPGLPEAISHLMWRIGIDSDVPIDQNEIQVKRVDLAVDYVSRPGDCAGAHLLAFAERVVVPNRMSVSYRDAGRVSVALSPSGSRRIIARIYDRAKSTGGPNGETVRAEAQLRWRPNRRPTLADVLNLVDPNERWLQALDELLPVSPEAVATSPDIDGILETHAAGLISSSVAERMIGTLVAMRLGLELWSKEGGRRRRTGLAKWGIAATRGDEPISRVDFAGLRSMSQNAWSESKLRVERAA